MFMQFPVRHDKKVALLPVKTNAINQQYRVPRFSDLPEIDVVLVDRKDLPSAGAGETPIVAAAPAIANAIFDATGKRLRAMPLRLI